MELSEDRILVRDLESDLYDGQVLQKLVEKLIAVKINHPEVSQTEMGQRQRLKVKISRFDIIMLRLYSYPLEFLSVMVPDIFFCFVISHPVFVFLERETVFNCCDVSACLR